MSGKRQATSDINQDNWDDEEKPEDRGQFRTASQDELKTRVIKKARRKITGKDVSDGSEEQPKKSVFSGFAGFGKTSVASNESSPFSFLSKMDGGKPGFSFGGSSATKKEEAASSTFSLENKSCSKTEVTNNIPSPDFFTFGVKNCPKKDELSHIATTANSLSSSNENGKQDTGKSSTNAPKKDEENNKIASSSKSFSFGEKASDSISTSSKDPSTYNKFPFSSTGNQKTEKTVTSTVTSSSFGLSRFSPKSSSEEKSQNEQSTSVFGVASKKLEPGKVTELPSINTNSNSLNNNYEGKSQNYYTKLKELNRQISIWINKHVEQTPLCVLTPIFNDYEKYLKQLDEEDDNRKMTPSIQTASNLINFEKPSSTTSNTALRDNFGFGANTSATSTVTSTTYSFGASLSQNSTPTSSVSSNFFNVRGITTEAPKTSSVTAITSASSSSISTFSDGKKNTSAVSDKTTFSFGGNAFKNSSNIATTTSNSIIFNLGDKTSNGNALSTNVSSSACVKASTTTTAATSTFSFGNKPNETKIISTAVTTSAPSSIFSFGLKTAGAPDTITSPSSSNGFGFSAKPSSSAFTFAKPFDDKKTSTPTPTPSFNFSNSTPFSFTNVGPPPTAPTSTNKPDGVENEDEDSPPKVEFKQVVEDDAVYSKKCKVFVKKDKDFADRGVGTLYLKPVKDSDKTQLIVRADTNLGNILVNLILNKAIPSKRMGKNNVMMVCIPTPDVEKPTPLLLRVKTGEEADDLLAVINKYTK